MATKMLIAGVLAMLIPGSLVAQAVSGNQDPPGLDWRQIQTKRFTVIFPEAITTDAQRVANTLEHIYGPVSKTLRGPQKPLEMVLTNQAAKFGGLVALAPRRSVWFSTPPPKHGAAQRRVVRTAGAPRDAPRSAVRPYAPGARSLGRGAIRRNG